MKVCINCKGEFEGRYCRQCHNAKARRSYAKNNRKHKDFHLRTTFGISVSDYEQMESNQGHLCAICRRPERASVAGKRGQSKRRLAVDHDHDTGVIRGLLCHACNTALGKFEDNPELLRAAIYYLQRYPIKMGEAL